MAEKETYEQLKQRIKELENEVLSYKLNEKNYLRERELEEESKAIGEIIQNMLEGEMADPQTEVNVLNVCLKSTNSIYGMIGKINKEGNYDTTTYSSQTLDDCAFPEALTWEMSTGMLIRGIWGYPMLHDKPLICNDLLSHPDRVGYPDGHVPIKRFLGVPLRRHGKVAGMVAVANKPVDYTKKDKDTLIRLAAVISISAQYRRDLIKRKRAENALRKAHDELEQRVQERTAQLRQEITQRQRVEEALREAEQLFRVVFDQAGDSIVIIDSFSGRIVNFNEKAHSNLGYSREEFHHLSLEHIEALDPGEESVLRPEKGVVRSCDAYEAKLRRKDGEIRHVLVSAKTIQIKGKKYDVIIWHDITDRIEADQEMKQLEEKLRQTQKMEAIGTLAGGIAHDFNNILTVILGYADMVLEELPEGNQLRANQQEVIQAGNRAKNLVTQILAFSRQAEKELTTVQPHLIVKECMKLLRSSIPTTIEIRERIAPDCGRILADPTQVHQIIMNLCTNAYHAMRKTGGVLSVSLAPVTIEKADLKVLELALTPGPYLKLEVSDTGYGMDRNTLEKIFDPYFTTKKKGEGTGLGLAVVHGIVKSYAGHISVYSEPGEGTTFRIYLPCSATDVMPQYPENVSPYPRGTENILIVDDEAGIVEMECRMLESLGYQVSTFTSSRDALKAFQDTPEKFDLVITDMTMPHMTGVGLTQKMLTIRPDIPIILSTGFSELIDADKAKALGIREYIMKPVIKRDLATAVRKVLDEKPS